MFEKNIFGCFRLDELSVCSSRGGTSEDFFWNVIQRSLVEMYRRFGGISCPSFQGSYFDDGDSVSSRNIGKSLPDCMVSHQKRTVTID